MWSISILLVREARIHGKLLVFAPIKIVNGGGNQDGGQSISLPDYLLVKGAWNNRLSYYGT